MSNARNRAISVSSAIASLPKQYVMRRSQSTPTGPAPKSIRVVVLGVGGVGKTGKAKNIILINILSISLKSFCASRVKEVQSEKCGCATLNTYLGAMSDVLLFLHPKLQFNIYTNVPVLKSLYLWLNNFRRRSHIVFSNTVTSSYHTRNIKFQSLA